MYLQDLPKAERGEHRLTSSRVQPSDRARIQIVMPVHNEADTIEQVLREIHAELSSRLEVEFILSEDGSRDGTPGVLQRLAGEFPIKLITGPERKGYARAVTDAFRLVDADWVLFLDSDGQYVPADYWRFHPYRETHDLIVGWRVRRVEPLGRRLMSRSFGLLHRLLFHVPLHDPSCSFVLMRRELITQLLPGLGRLTEGFWWEFTARAHARGATIKEIPVQHRLRAQGQTRVFHPSAIPRIALRNVSGLLAIRGEIRRAAAPRTRG